MSFLFGNNERRSGSTASPAASISPTPRMPTRSDAVSRLAANRERSRVMGRSGRSSTILSSREPGVNAYGNSLLGQT